MLSLETTRVKLQVIFLKEIKKKNLKKKLKNQKKKLKNLKSALTFSVRVLSVNKSIAGHDAARLNDFIHPITVCQLSENGVKLINILKGHNGSIQSLFWDGTKGWLYSGSYDSSVFVWDIGGRKGTVYELTGHRNKVNTVCYIANSTTLMSTGEDSNLVLWDMSINRSETCEWAESDTCQLCNRPFYWNFKAMYDQKTIGLRQHHCR